jgi:hypothetical protein
MLLQKCKTTSTFLSVREEADASLAVRLREEGKITTLGVPFEESSKHEIHSLTENGGFRFITFNKRDHGNERIFNSRIVNEIKGKVTDAPYEKSRLVVQGYGDDGIECYETAVAVRSNGC